MRDVKEKYGATPVRVLAREGILSDTFVGVHAVWVDPEEIDILSQYGASVVHCPGSNAKLGNGLAPVGEMLAAGIPVGLGTDGPASNNRQDLFHEMDFCAKGHKLVTRDPSVMDARTVLKMALYLGAEALGIEETAGSLSARYGRRYDRPRPFAPRTRRRCFRTSPTWSTAPGGWT